jgi:5-methyltetrahydropteroyltriglutamate--homocysteine methyltransferase
VRRSTDRILTTHVGALPVPPQLAAGATTDDDLRAAVRQVVQEQRAAGIDFVNEGELTKGGNFVTYINERLSGFEAGDATVMTSVLTSSRDWTEFADFYGKAVKNGTLFETTGSAPSQVTTRRM